MSYPERKRSFNQYNYDDGYDNNDNSYKKRKYNDHESNTSNNDNEDYVDVLPLINCNKPRSWTVSVAISGSVMDTASTPQLQSYLASEFARILSIFCIDEIIIFSESGKLIEEKKFKSDPNLFMERLLKYLDTPQYLRRLLFPFHSDFRYVGMCRPLRTPNHAGKYELSPYREGIVLKKSIIHPKMPKKAINENENENEKITNNLHGNYVSLVNIGLDRYCVIDKELTRNTRVTVKIDDYKNECKDDNEKYCFGSVVSSSEPLEKDGIYWGYKTRLAMDISEVLTKCEFDDEIGYDHIIGTSDKGDNIFEIDENGNNTFSIPKFKHLLIVFGGPNGLESCQLNKDNKLTKPRLLFDQYINVCPYQGTRTIRSEEAFLMTLSVLQPYLQKNYMYHH